MNFEHSKEFVKSLGFVPLFLGFKGAQIQLQLLTFDEKGVL